MKEVYKLDNWAIVYNGSPYTAPEIRSQSLCGDRGDNIVTTSRIIGKIGNCVATMNSLYMLERPSLEYEAVYPNAKQRLFDSLTEIEE